MLGSVALSGVMASCSVDEFISNKDLVSKLEKFHFETSEEVTLNIDYGPLATRALVQVYEKNPLAGATEEDQTPKGQTIFSAFLDENGQYQGTISLPAHVKHLYFYTGSMAAPQLTDAKVDGNCVKVASPAIEHNATRATRAIVPDNQQLVVRKLESSEKVGNANNFYTIVGGWDEYGKPENINGNIDEGDLTGDDVLSIEHYFWMGATSKPSSVTEERKARLNAMKVDNVNMVVQEQYEENGVIYDVESAEIWFTFLTEYAWNENTVGYYFFDKNNPPKSADKIDKKFVILPHTSKPNHYPFDKKQSYCYPTDKYPVHTNMRVQLLYVDKDGHATKNFPPNVEVGFFLISNGFKCGDYTGDKITVDGKEYTTRKAGYVNTTGKTFYSNYKFNEGQEKRYVACRLADGTVVYGNEDGSDGSFDDMMFTVTASPNKAIHTEGGSTLQSIPAQKVPRTYTDQSEVFTYAFENMWPDGGDYDLNDVIVRLSRTITKDQFNDVSKVVDNFTFDVNQYTTSSCSFAIQTSHKGDRYTLPAGAWYEEETGSFFFAEDVRNSNVNHKTLTLTREFDHPVSFNEIQNELNPFIVNQSKGVDCHTNGRVEIHLPMGEVTSMGMKINNVKNPAKAWYISDDGQAPYALKISGTTFDPCDEKVRIGSGAGAYPNFHKWVNSLGKEYKDWYKNK